MGVVVGVVLVGAGRPAPPAASAVSLGNMGMNKDQQLAAIVGGLVAVFASVGVIVAWATGFIS